MKFNEELLRRAQAAIVETCRVDMDVWAQDKHGGRPMFARSVRQGTLKEGCETVGCIAGWIIVSASDEEWEGLGISAVSDPAHAGAALLGVQTFEHTQKGVNPDELFFLSWWPSGDHRAYLRAETAEARAQAMSDRIDDWIAAIKAV